MIILVHAFPLPEVQQVAAELAGLADGAVLSLPEGVRSAEPVLAGMNEQVREHRDQGKNTLILCRGFLDAAELREVRVALGAVDDEIYAFRLRLPAEGPLQRRWQEQQDHDAETMDAGFVIDLETPDWVVAAQKIWGDIHAPVEQVAHRQEWVAMYAAERVSILNALNRPGIEVEHIGSTAVPGIPAKPIIDILIALEDLDDARACILPLRALGYAFIDYPQNVTRRFFRKGQPRSHHLHIVVAGSRSHRDHVDFRDALLADEDLRDAYRQLKLDALEKYRDRRARFGERKTDFIQEVLGRYRGAR